MRLFAVFLVALFWTSMLIPSASAITAAEIERHQTEALQKSQAAAKTHIKPLDESQRNKPMKQNYAPGAKPTVSKQQAAADAAPANTILAQLGSKTPSQPGEALQSIETPKIKPHELTDKRTATSSLSVNADGSLTKKNFFTPKFYKKDGKWETIHTSLVEDKNAGDSGNALGKLFGTVKSWFSDETTFTVVDNDWQARFAPSDFEDGLLRVKKGSDQIGFVPIGANKVKPQLETNKNGQQVVHYPNLWDGIDVDYLVESAAVKESVIIKNKDAANSVSFKVAGASLKAEGKGQDKLYKITGAFNDEFGITPPNLILNNFGPEPDASLFSQEYKDGKVVLSVDKSYLQSLPEKAFPAVIDPGVFTSSFGNRNTGTYMSFRNDNLVCGYHNCNVYAGWRVDAQGYWRLWRGAFYVPYDQFRNSA
jgi:hypothetical protein